MQLLKHSAAFLLSLLSGIPIAAAQINLNGAVLEAGDRLGHAVANGDFNCDSYDDLAVGVPGEDFSVGGSDTGAIHIIYGGTVRLSSNQVFTQRDFTTAAASERFGSALVSGDFNGDNCDDLAVGIPDDGLAAPAAGGVVVVFGVASGISAGGPSQYWSQDSSGIGGVAETNDDFGHALAAGDFNNDGFDDLAIGAPGEAIGSLVSAGAVNVIYGGLQGLAGAGSQLLHQDITDFPHIAEEMDYFGWSLAAGDFDGNGYDDLAIGIKGEDQTATPTTQHQGAVQVVYAFSGTRLSVASTAFWSQGTTDMLGDFGSSDEFGSSLAAGDFNADGRDDLAIGVPGGREVNVLYGTAAGGLSVSGNQLWLPTAGQLSSSFGAALTAGDFNSDGWDDLVVGDPDESMQVVPGTHALDVGSVYVLYGALSGGLVATGRLHFHQDTAGVLDERNPPDRFGFAVSSGDFNNDGYADLAVGVPTEGGASSSGANAVFEAGIVQVFYGTSSGMSFPDNQLFVQ